MPKFDRKRPWPVRTKERFNTAIAELTVLGSPSKRQVGRAVADQTRDMPGHWGTSKKVSQASADDAARGAINNLTKLVAEQQHIGSFSVADKQTVDSLTRQLCDLCQGFSLQYELSRERSDALSQAMSGYLAAYCL